MWIFEANYVNMDTNSSIDSVKRKIEFDGDNFFNSSKECYHYALDRALEMQKAEEYLCSLEFIAC